MKPINFVMSNTGAFYLGVVRSLIDPIEKYLPEFYETNDCMKNAINVHFFLEPRNYFKKINVTGTNVFISHGIADKNWRNASKVKVFDYVCVSGPSWVNKMIRQGLDKSKILVVGYTKLDPIFQGEIVKESSDKPVVLYAPTHNLPGWTGRKGASAYPNFMQLLENMPKEFKTITSLHPANSKGVVTLQGLANADVVISDCSSIIYEAWSLGKPVVFPDWIVKDYIQKTYNNSFEDYIYKNKIGYHATNMEDLCELVKLAYKKGIDKTTQDFIEDIFPQKLRGKSGKESASMLLKLAEGSI
jgi:CDP-glycerol glycerophosphotransferase (TagB/SpsB family)